MDVGDCGVVDIVPGDCWVRGSNARGMGRAWDGGMGNASDGGLGNAAYVGTTDGCAGGDGNADGYCDTSAYGDALGARPWPATPLATATAMAATTLATATPLATATLLAADTSEGQSREMGEYEGVTFVVSEGSEATFTVTEKLASLSLPNDAVMRTVSLSGEVRLDGGASVFEIDLHSLSSDQANRDRYVQTRMFGGYPTATLTVPSVSDIPEGFAEGSEVETQVSGSLEIRGITVPLVFDIEARDDGDRVVILGRTTFTWQQLDITPPKAGPVTSIEDEVRVEVLLSVEP